MTIFLSGEGVGGILVVQIQFICIIDEVPLLGHTQMHKISFVRSYANVLAFFCLGSSMKDLESLERGVILK